MRKKCIEEVMTASEAQKLWGLKSESTVRTYIARGKFKEGEYRKSGETWLVTREAMHRVFGEPK